MARLPLKVAREAPDSASTRSSSFATYSAKIAANRPQAAVAVSAQAALPVCQVSVAN
jgi:hypothetical protein